MHRGDRDLNDDDQQVVGGDHIVYSILYIVVGGGEPAYGSSLIADKNLRKSLQEGFAQWIN